jgi:hypothetical protein
MKINHEYTNKQPSCIHSYSCIRGYMYLAVVKPLPYLAEKPPLLFGCEECR